MIRIVTYNLKGPATSYVQLYERLKVQGEWWHYLPATWLIQTDRTPDQIFEAIRGYLQTGDFVFIGTIQNGYNGWLPKAAWEWLQSRGISSTP